MAAKYPIEPFPADIDRNAFGHWLSGFTDGEGNFHLGTHNSSNRSQVCVLFQLRLRADDFVIVRLIQSYFNCGQFNYCKGGGGGKPIASLAIAGSTAARRALIPHFDRFPLRSKKARDYEIWKCGVLFAYEISLRRKQALGGRRGGTKPKWTPRDVQQYQAIADLLKSTRKYIQPADLGGEGTSSDWRSQLPAAKKPGWTPLFGPCED